MKALPSIAFNEFKGTAGEVTARRIGGSTVLNGRAQHSKVKSPKQSERRAHFGFITRQFRQLTEEQQKAWSDLAAQHRERVLIGDGEPLTAFNLFVCLNANRAAMGVEPTHDAPEYVHGSSYIAFDDIFITPSRLMITGLRDPENPNARLVVKMASTESNGVSKLWGNTVIVGKFHESDWGDVELTAAYLEQFGVPIVEGRKYFIEMYWLDEYSGYISEITRVCYPAVAETSIHGREYAPRKILKTENAVNNDRYAAHAIDMEIASPYRAATEDIIAERLQGYLGGMEIALNAPIDGRDSFRHFITARSTSDADVPYSVSFYEVSIDSFNRDITLRLSNRGGHFEPKAEIFGTALTIDKLA